MIRFVEAGAQTKPKTSSVPAMTESQTSSPEKPATRATKPPPRKRGRAA